MSTMSLHPSAAATGATDHPGTLRALWGTVPWMTVVPLAVVLAYADGFWLISLRGAVGSIERTQEPFVTWLRESTLILPVFVLGVVGALLLAARWFGPVLRKPKTVVATMLMIVAAGTLVGIAEVAASSAYDYHLQSEEIQLQGSMHHMSVTPSFTPVTDAETPNQREQASLRLQVHAASYGSGMLLVTNLALVTWVVAMRGGRLNVSKTRR